MDAVKALMKTWTYSYLAGVEEKVLTLFILFYTKGASLWWTHWTDVLWFPFPVWVGVSLPHFFFVVLSFGRGVQWLDVGSQFLDQILNPGGGGERAEF